MKEKYVLREGQGIHIKDTNLVLEPGDVIEYEKTETDSVKKVAAYLHGQFCKCDHNGGRCGWFYEDNNWDMPEHKRWLEKTGKLLCFLLEKFILSGDDKTDIPLVKGLIDIFSEIHL